MKELWKTILSLFSCIENRRKFHLLLILCFTIFCSLIEILSLSTIIPLLNLFNDPGIIVDYKIVNILSKAIPINFNDFSTIAIIFIILATAATVSRIYLIWISNSLSQSIFADLATMLYSQTLNQDYIKFIKTDSSESISNILIKSSTIESTITCVVNIMISIIMVLFISGALFYVEPLLTIYAFIIILFYYLFLSSYTTRIFRSNGHSLAREVPNQLGIVSGSLRAYKNIVIENLEHYFVKKYRTSVMKVKKIAVINIFLSQTPRYLLEGVMMVLVGIYLLSINGGEDQFVKISTLAFIGASAQRLIPILHTLYSNFQSFNSNHHSLTDVVSTLKIKSKVNKKLLSQTHSNSMVFNHEIEFENVSFRYSKNEKWILRNSSFKIKKGHIVGIVGSSGLGKTTVTDLLSGLIKPSEGRILVDGKSIHANILAWRRNITLVPQEPFFFDRSVKKNITAYDSEIIHKKKNLDKVIEIFQLESLLRLKRIGDNGALISGGQKQRIALARAFYQNKNIILLDEATNAVDSILENIILKNIVKYFPTHTIILISHRSATLKICKTIIDVKKVNNL